MFPHQTSMRDPSTPKTAAIVKVQMIPILDPNRKRDRAILALLILTGVLDAALVSLRLKHLGLKEQRLDQYGREVDTKFGTSMWIRFFPYAEPAH